MLKFVPTNEDASNSLAFEDLLFSRLAERIEIELNNRLADINDAEVTGAFVTVRDGKIVIELESAQTFAPNLELESSELEDYRFGSDQESEEVDSDNLRLDTKAVVQKSVRTVMESLPTIALDVKRELNNE